MKKKILSLMLAFTIMFSLCTTAFANNSTNTPSAAIITADNSSYIDEEAHIKENCNSFTVIFSDKNNNSRSASQKSVADLQNCDATRQFVDSLDLENYPQLKDFYDKQIDEIEAIGGVITEYTVYIPKANTLSASSLPVYGTYNGRTYYYTFFSSVTYEMKQNTQRTLSVLMDVLDGGVDFMIGLLGNVIAVSYAAIRVALDMPPNYSVSNGDYVESKIKVVVNNVRGILCENSDGYYAGGTTDMIVVYTGESGYARPYMVWHHATVTGDPESSGWVASSQFCNTDGYYSTNTTLQRCDFLYNSGNIGHHYLTDVVSQGARLWWE